MTWQRSLADVAVGDECGHAEVKPIASCFALQPWARSAFVTSSYTPQRRRGIPSVKLGFAGLRAWRLAGTAALARRYELRPYKAHKKRRHSAERNVEIRAAANKRVSRHLRRAGFIRVLNNGDAANSLDRPQTVSSIFAVAREDDANDA